MTARSAKGGDVWDPQPIVVSFAGPSGTGKTSLLIEVVRQLTETGMNVAVVKHHNHAIELDRDGKDTERLRKAGAGSATLVGANQVAWMSDDSRPPPLADIVGVFHRDADLILVEGYRSARLPTVIVHREEAADPTWQRPPNSEVLAEVHPDDVDKVVALLRNRVEARR